MERIKEGIKERILETLKQSQDLSLDPSLAQKSRDEIVENLLQYHEELIFQNDELKASYAALEVLQQKYEMLFEKAPMMYIYLDESFKIIEFNELCQRFMSRIQKGRQIQDIIHAESQDTLYFHLRKLEKSDMRLVDQVMIPVGGLKRHYKLMSHPLMIADKRFYQCALADITDEIDREKRIQYLSFHDGLTGLYNRRFFNEELMRLDTKRNLPVAVIMSDVNGLKLMNDTFGHEVGDELLIATSKLLRDQFRGDEIVARYGGDEFAIILDKVDKPTVEKIIKRLENESQKLIVRDVRVSIAFGSAVKKHVDEPIHQVLKRAEDRMYQKKLLMNENYHRSVINGILSTLHEKHPREERHSMRVRSYVVGFSEYMDYGHSQKIAFETAGLVHDIGKIAIDYSVLELQRRLTPLEYESVKKHVDAGFRILKSCGLFAEVQDIVLSHHERYDGKGYPRGLTGDEIPLGARIINLCDSYDAMINERPYKPTRSSEQALDEILRGAGTQFDPALAGHFVDFIRQTVEVK